MTSSRSLRLLAGACALVLAGTGALQAQDKGPVTYVGPSAAAETQPATDETQPAANDAAAYEPAQLDQMLGLKQNAKVREEVGA